MQKYSSPSIGWSTHYRDFYELKSQRRWHPNMASPFFRCKFAVSLTKENAKRFSLKKDAHEPIVSVFEDAFLVPQLASWQLFRHVAPFNGLRRYTPYSQYGQRWRGCVPAALRLIILKKTDSVGHQQLEFLLVKITRYNLLNLVRKQAVSLLVSLVKINFTVVLEYLGAMPAGISLFGEGQRESRPHIMRVRKMFIIRYSNAAAGVPIFDQQIY